jgi:hypothetical protein
MTIEGKVVDEKTGDITLKCANCMKTAIFGNEDEAYDAGWDFPPAMPINFVTCPRCPSAPLLFIGGD